MKQFFCSFSDFAHLYKAIHQVLGLAPLRLELLLHKGLRAYLPEQHSWLGTGIDPNECAQGPGEKQPLFNGSLEISSVLYTNASQCHVFLCNKREGPDVLSTTALRARKELGKYHFV